MNDEDVREAAERLIANAGATEKYPTILQINSSVRDIRTVTRYVLAALSREPADAGETLRDELGIEVTPERIAELHQHFVFRSDSAARDVGLILNAQQTEIVRLRAALAPPAGSPETGGAGEGERDAPR
jgi:hypothetical protein